MRLDQLGTVERGRSRHRPRNDPALYNGAYPFVQTSDVKEAGLRLYNYSQTYNDAGLAQSRLWPAGTLCFTIAANIGDTAILGIPACFPDSIVGFTPYPDKADTVFVKYALEYTKLKFSAISKGATQDNLSLEKLLSQDLLVPQLETQQRIASILGAYDDLIEVNRRRVKLLEEMARGLFEEWFVRFRFPGHQTIPLLETPNGKLPEGWRFGPFTLVADVLSGGTPKKERPEYWGGTIPFFTPRDAPASAWVAETINNVTESGVKNCNSQLYPRQTVFITARGTVGKVALAAVPMAMNQSCYALKGRCYPQLFVYGFTQFAAARLQGMSNGAVFDTIIVDTFHKLELPIPPLDLAKEYDRRVSSILELSDNLTASIRKLSASRDLLLPRLISGQLSVEAAEQQLAAAD